MKKLDSYISKYWLLFIIAMQPILDILAFFNFNTNITWISFIARSLMLILAVFYTFIKIKDKKKYVLLILPIAIFSLFHIINSLRCGTYSIFADIRYLIIVMQLPIYIVAFTLYLKENAEAASQIKKGLVISFIIILLSLILSFLLKNYNTTYNSNTGGYGLTGWFSSANTQSMILSVLCPVFILYFSINKSKSAYFLGHLLTFFVLYINSTKACFYTMIAVFFLVSFISFFQKKNTNKYFYIFISILFLFISIISYNNSPTFIRKQDVSDVVNNNKDIIAEIEKKFEIEIEQVKKFESEINEIDSEEKKEYIKKSEYQIALAKLNTSYLYRELMDIHGEEKVVEKMKNRISESTLSDNRLRKVVHAEIIYDESDFITKLLGFDFSKVSKYGLDMENDLTALFYYYGYLGFGLYLSYLLYFIIIAFKSIVKYPMMIFNSEFMILCFSFALAILGGQYSGAFLRKSNANIYLALILSLLYVVCIEKINSNNKKKLKKKNKRKTIKFLVLHLGYGGIETATINTANSLCEKYYVKIISFYNLKNNQAKKINRKIEIDYLYNFEPNREAFNKAFHQKQFFKVLKEGCQSLKILFLKKYLLIKEILKDDCEVIVSTRMEFSILLNSFGKKEIIKIAQEHQYHNNCKKYINTIKNRYNNIDYLFALTKTLKKDYEKYLVNNNHTQIVLVPNMIINYPKTIFLDKPLNIISVGRLHPNKRINELITIFSQIENKKSKFYIIGDGEEYKSLNNLIQKLKIQNRVEMLGYLDEINIRKHMNQSSLFLMASISEGLPMVLIEAMSNGLPCIAYKTPNGIDDIIKNGENGFIIENRDESQFIQKINEILSNKKLREKLSSNAIVYSKKFSCENIIKIWDSVIGD